MIETKSKVIGGVEYRVTALGASQGFPVLTDIGQLIAPGVAAVKSLEELDDAVFPAIGAVLQNLDGAKVIGIAQRLAQQTMIVEGGKTFPLAGLFETHFAARPMDVVEFVAFAAEVNGLSDFLSRISARLPKRPAPKPPAKAQDSTSPSASTASGVSGDSSSTGDFRS